MDLETAQAQIKELHDLLQRVTAELAVVRAQIPPPDVPPAPPIHHGNGAPLRTLAKCQVVYDGKDPSRVAAFLRQVEDYRLAKEVTEAAALRSFALILQGPALDWWHGKRDQIHSWADFTDVLRTSYQPWEYDFQILDEIRARKQQRGETINEYSVVIRELFLRMRRPPDENEQIQRIVINLQPNYHPYLKREELRTYGELERQGKTAEAIHKDILQFKASNPTSGKDREPPKKEKEKTDRPKEKEPPRPVKPPPTKWCDFCSIRGHTQEECRKKKEKNALSTPPPVTHVTNMIAGNSSALPYVALEVNGLPVTALYDSGSSISLINELTLQRLQGRYVRTSNSPTRYRISTLHGTELSNTKAHIRTVIGGY